MWEVEHSLNCQSSRIIDARADLLRAGEPNSSKKDPTTCPVFKRSGNNRHVNERTDSVLLLEYVENRSEGAFAELVRKHIDFVYSSAVRMVVDPHLAEDVTQATFAALARDGRRLAHRLTLTGWLHRTAVNTAAKLVRGEMRRRAREQEAYAMRTAEPESESGWSEIAPKLDAALNQLSEVDRMVLFLRYFEKKSASQIGEALKTTEEAAQKRTLRALDRLRGILSIQGINLSTTTMAGLILSEAVGAAPVGLALAVSTSALAGTAAAGGITFSAIKLLMMSKMKMGAAAVLVAAGVVTPLVIQHQNLNSVRSQNAMFQEQIEQGRAVHERLDQELTNARRSEGISRAQLKELMRLRSEVGPLRRDSQELARIRGASGGDASAPTAEDPVNASFVPAATWANMGAENPAAAIQTFFWAGKHGETNLVGSLLRWQRDTAIPESKQLDEMFAQALVGGTTQFAGSLQGYRVLSEESASENEVRMNIEMTDAEGNARAHALRLVREENQWFPVIHLWMGDQQSVRAALDVPPRFQGAP